MEELDGIMVIRNQDIIDFRVRLIDLCCGKDSKYEIDPVVLSVYSEILVEFNNHFGAKGYDLG